MKQFIFDWILPPKLAINLQIVLSKIKNRLKYDQSLFEKNEALRDIEKGKRCFVIAPGPSINNQDLSLLKDETCIAISTVYAHKDFAAINPKYYVLSPVFKHHATISKEENLVSWARDMDASLHDNTIIFAYVGDKGYFDKYNIFQNKEVYWLQYIPWDEGAIKEIDLQNLPDIRSVSEATFSIAIYLGFNNIFILGFDHNWFDGLNVYFNQKSYSKHFDLTGKDIAEKTGRDTERIMWGQAKMFRKYKALFAIHHNIFNANKNENTHVDTFPKVRYENLFKDKQSDQ